MKRILSFLLCIILAFSLSACGRMPLKTESRAPKDDFQMNNVSLEELNAEPTGDVRMSITANEFDEAFLSYMNNSVSGNYMVSPLSFRYALGLLLAGAAGDTKAELLKALCVKSVDEWTDYCLKFNGFTKYFYEQLDEEIQFHKEYVKKGYIDQNSAKPFRALRVANSVWKKEDIKEDFKEEYLKYIRKNYGAEYFRFTEKNVVENVNRWASEKTEKMIPELLPANYETDNLAVVLMNALYYKSCWVKRFYDAATQETDFYTQDGKIVKKSFMEQTEDFAYYADNDTQLVILPMAGGINMAFVLGDTFDIAEKVSAAKKRSVTVKIPKIDIETSLSQGELMDFLEERGVSKAFDSDEADFSEMIDHQIWVDDIIQKTKIKTDEDGVEAAAVTAILMAEKACFIEEAPMEFIADRPFSFYIYTTCNDVTATLFAGRVVE